jgi:hypothetical protein
MAVEVSVDLPVVAAILFEDFQLVLQAVFITENSGSVYQSGKYRLLIGWVMMGLSVEIEIGGSGLAVHVASHRAIRSAVNM